MHYPWILYMTYNEITSYPRAWNKTLYPEVAHIEIPAEKFRRIERLIDDQTQTRVLGHDLLDANWIVLHVGCTSVDVKARLERRWAA
jgi:hypothetical protein